MIQPSALNFMTIALSFIIFAFLWRMGAAALINRNLDSPVGKAMAAIYS